MMSTGRTRPWAALIRRFAPPSPRGRLLGTMRARRGLVEWVAPAACGALIGALLDGLNRLISAMG